MTLYNVALSRCYYKFVFLLYFCVNVTQFLKYFCCLNFYKIYIFGFTGSMVAFDLF